MKTTRRGFFGTLAGVMGAILAVLSGFKLPKADPLKHWTP